MEDGRIRSLSTCTLKQIPNRGTLRKGRREKTKNEIRGREKERNAKDSTKIPADVRTSVKKRVFDLLGAGSSEQNERMNGVEFGRRRFPGGRLSIL